jgi:hypothetical protein
MNGLIRHLNKTGLLQSDIDYHLIRASMVPISLLFGYQKCWSLRGKRAALCDVRYWHEADIKLRPLFGCYRVESGHHWLVVSISAYDP